MKLLQVVSKSKYCSQVQYCIVSVYLKLAATAPLRNDPLFNDINADPHQWSVNIAGHRQQPTRKHINQFGVHAVIVCVLVWVSCQIIILWNSEKPPPHRSKWPPMPVPLIITDGRRKVSIQVWEQSSHVCKRWWDLALSLCTSCLTRLFSPVPSVFADEQPFPATCSYWNGGGFEPRWRHSAVDQRGRVSSFSYIVLFHFNIFIYHYFLPYNIPCIIFELQ